MEKRDVLGWVLVALGVLSLATHFLLGNPRHAVWFSNHTFLVMGVAVLLRSRFWVFAELCIGFIPELVWSADYVYRLFTGEFLWNLTNYMFVEGGGFNWLHLYSLSHLLFVPAGLLALFVLGGPVRQAYLGSFVHLVILWPLSMAFGTEYNLNCVFHHCQVLEFLPQYQILWPVTMVVHVFLVYWVVWLLWKK